MTGFLIWLLTGLVFTVIGISCFFSKKPAGFWANAKLPEIADIKNYNRAVGKLFCIFSVVFILLGLPMLKGQNSLLIILSILGVFAEVIITMVVYTMVIEKKYRK